MARNTKSLELIFKDLTGHDNAVVIDRYPDLCPACDHGIDAKLIDAYGRTDLDGNGHHVQAIFQCPRQECQIIFVAHYTSGYFSPRNYSEYVFLKGCRVPSYLETEKFEEEIVKLSPQFVTIFSQAKTAEEMNLDLICGCGYRKALEFLIKDYLVNKYSAEKKAVLANSLGWLIANKVDSEKIKVTAGLAKDVGNDETHYQKKMEELSLDDLKKLIRLTTHWITDELLTNHYAEKVN